MAVPVTTVCSRCNATLTIKVCCSIAGHYLGYTCPKDGPYDRVTVYMTEERANFILENLHLLTDPSVVRRLSYSG